MTQNIIELKLNKNYNLKEEVCIYGLKGRVHAKNGNLYHVEFYESKEKIISKLGKISEASKFYCSSFNEFPVGKTNDNHSKRSRILDEGLDEIISDAINKIAEEESLK